MEKGVISNSQFTILVILFMVSSSTIIAPPLLVIEAKRDAWLSALVTLGLGLMLAWMNGILARRHPGLNLAEKCERILGKWAGKSVSFLFFLYFLLLTAALTRILGDFITTLIMSDTPIQAIEIALLLTVIIGVRLGLEVWARTAELLFPWVMLFFLFLVLTLLPEIRFDRFMPILENGIRQVLNGVYPLIGIPYLDLFVFLMITPYVTLTGKIGRNFMTGVFIGGLILFLNIFLSIAVLGDEHTARLYYPVYQLAKKISIGRFVQRVEVLTGGIMFISIFVKITICFYSTALSFSRLLGTRSYHSYTLPLGMLIVGLSLIISPNIVQFERFALESWSPLSMIFGIVLPLLLLFVDRLRKNQA